jgi:hypothetical protein
MQQPSRTPRMKPQVSLAARLTANGENGQPAAPGRHTNKRHLYVLLPIKVEKICRLWG